MGPPEGKYLMPLKIIKFDINSKNGSRILGVTSGGLHPETKLQVLAIPNQRHLKI